VSTWFNFRRYRGPMIVAASIAATIVLLDLSLTASIGSPARFLPHGESPTDFSVLDHAGSRLAGLIAEARLKKTVDSRPLGVFLGQSTLESGIDSTIVDQAYPRYRWLNLFGLGGSVHRIADINELLIISDLDPKIIVVAINPYMLVGSPYGVVRSAEFSMTRNRIKPWIWSIENRPLVNHLNRFVLHRGRLSIFNALKQTIDAIYPADPKPWVVTPPIPRSSYNQAELETKLNYDKKLGWYDPLNYTESSSNWTELERIVAGWKRRGVEVVVMLMPERTPMREHSPAEAVKIFKQLDTDVPLIDLRDKLDDSCFIDLDHINPDGRRRCSRIVGESLRDRLENREASRSPNRIDPSQR
jgi:hypothetical protein